MYKKCMLTMIVLNVVMSTVIIKNAQENTMQFLNLAHISLLSEKSVCVFVCMCLPLRLSITNGVMWHDMYPM